MYAPDAFFLSIQHIKETFVWNSYILSTLVKSVRSVNIGKVTEKSSQRNEAEHILNYISEFLLGHYACTNVDALLIII